VQDDSEDPGAVPDTQKIAGLEKQGPEDEFAGYLSDDDGASDFSNDSHTPKKRKTVHAVEKQPPKADSKTEAKGATEKKSNVIKKVVRKAGETVNANYRRLKIKGKDKQNGGKGRFGRRR
jgi:hypothetical protein